VEQESRAPNSFQCSCFSIFSFLCSVLKIIVCFFLYFFFWPLYCLFSFGHLLSFLFWPLYCLFSFDHYTVFSPLAIILSFLFWPLYCLFSFGHYTVFSPLAIILSSPLIQYIHRIFKYQYKLSVLVAISRENVAVYIG
jgi:hypothetical protein